MQSHAAWLLALLFDLVRQSQQVPLKRQLTFSRLHSIIFHNTELFMTSTVRASNPTLFNFFFSPKKVIVKQNMVNY
jgi:hypothetical protein